MVSKVLLLVGVLVAVAAAVPAQPGGAWPAAGGWQAGANPWIPQWLAQAPWFPQWSECTTIGTTCLDCTTKQVCTKVGGLKRACTDPTMPYCNLGECSATPSAGCTPAVPAAGAV